MSTVAVDLVCCCLFFRDIVSLAGDMNELEDRTDLVSDGLATLTEAAEYLRVGKTTLYEMMANGEIPYCKVRKARRIPWKSLMEYAASSLNIAEE